MIRTEEEPLKTAASAARRSGSSPFRARARLIRMLGEELISDEVMAVVELVKNSYDADARRVTVALGDITDPEQGLICIRDDGSGMDLDTLLHVWMEPATPRKRPRGGRKTRTALGRMPLGEKGVGRFAADKLGSELELVSRANGSEDEIVLQVGWHHFDVDGYLDEVESRWYMREPVEFVGSEHGIVLMIRSLRAVWNTEMVTRLQNGLTRLMSPYTSSSDFTIEISAADFPFASGQVANRIIEAAPYHISGAVDAHGIFTPAGTGGPVLDLRTLCHGHFTDADGHMREPECGPFCVSLNVWNLEPDRTGAPGISPDLRRIIKASSGVSIYRDGFRIWPYGERDDDWLELNQRRVNNPTLRVSNNQVIGFVEISHSDNPSLRDRTSREGLLDTPAFFDLRVLVLAALTQLETERFSQRRSSASTVPARTGKDDDILLQLVQMRSAVSQGGAGLRDSLRELEQLYRSRLDLERDRYNHVSHLAGTGMAAELLTDAFSRQVLNAMTALRILEGEARGGGNQRILGLVQGLAEQMDTLNGFLDLMGPLYRAEARDSAGVDVAGAISDVVSLMAGRLVEDEVRVTLEQVGRLTVRMSRGHLMQVLMILIENSLQTMREAASTDRSIHIKVVEESRRSAVLLADSGPGVSASFEKLIFQPYFSTRQAGRGLGLHVARDILARYNSTLELVSGVALMSGACFEINFDRRRISDDRRGVEDW
jgi:signal transduction histidine kinase